MKLNLNNLDYFENLPFREGRKSYLTNKFGNLYNLDKFDHPRYRSDKNDRCGVKLSRIIKKYLGKSFDDAFSEYCKQVEVYEQKDFFEEFNSNYGGKPFYIVDENGNIQFNPDSNYILNGNCWKRKITNKKPIIFRSLNYEEGYYGVKERQYFSISEYNKQHRFNEPNGCYIYCVINGFEKQFESKNDREFIRLTKEKHKQIKLHGKRLKKYFRNKEYCLKFIKPETL